MARRHYSAQKKANIVAFITAHDSEHGRGGIAAAKKKYGVSRLTLARWLKTGGKRPPAERAVAVSYRNGSLASRLDRMATIQRQMDRLQKEYGELKGRL